MTPVPAVWAGVRDAIPAANDIMRIKRTTHLYVISHLPTVSGKRKDLSSLRRCRRPTSADKEKQRAALHTRNQFLVYASYLASTCYESKFHLNQRSYILIEIPPMRFCRP